MPPIPQRAIVRLRDGESALFGYGSLLSIESLERTLGRRYAGSFLVCRVEGWRRSWDAAVPNRRVFFAEQPPGRLYPGHILYLNVRPAPGCFLNGVLFVVNAQERDAYDQREVVYDRVDITESLSGVSVTGGRAYIYVARPECSISSASSIAQAAVRATYLDIVAAGFRDLGPDFQAEYEATTDPVPRHLLIADRREQP